MNISEIAKLAGVSSATVSRYLNNGYLSEEKRERIQKVIQETGYVPSSSAQSLRTQKSNQVGVIVPKIDSETIGSVVRGVSNVLAENGYYVILGNTENSLEKEREYMRIFKNNKMDGIILIASCFPQKHLQELKKLSIPVVIVGQQLNGYCCVYHDDRHAAYELTKVLLQGNPGHVAFLGALEQDRAVGIDRRAGFEQAMEESGRSLEERAVRICEFSYESGKEQMADLLKQCPDTDAVFCVTDTIAAGAVEAIREAGLSIPEDVAVTGIGDSHLARVLSPQLTTAHDYYLESGIEAARMLLPLMHSQEMQVRQLLLGFAIKERGTTKKQSLQ